MTILTFNNTALTVHQANGQHWLSAQEISVALVYNRSSAVTEIYNRNRWEFGQDTSTSLKLRDKGGILRKRRLFNRRGSHLIAMFAKTDKARAFRKWVLDVLTDHQQVRQEERILEHSTIMRVMDMMEQDIIKQHDTIPETIRQAYLVSLDLSNALGEVERSRLLLAAHLEECARCVFPNGIPSYAPAPRL